MLQFKNTIKMQLIGMLEVRLIFRIMSYMKCLITNMPENDLKKCEKIFQKYALGEINRQKEDVLGGKQTYLRISGACTRQWQEILWKQRNNGAARKQTKNDGQRRKLSSTHFWKFI